ncbi:MAG: YraN family protein [Pseudomonadota bacterium]
MNRPTPTTEHLGKSRSDKGRAAYEVGCSAEDGVAAEYQRRGYRLLNRRWRGEAGEIDLIFQNSHGIVCVEVKRARNFDAAFSRVTPRQQARLFAAAEEYAAGQPGGTLTDIRFDVAAVDQRGMIEILENAFA